MEVDGSHKPGLHLMHHHDQNIPTLKLFITRDQRLWRLKGLRYRAVPSDGLSRRVGFGLTLGPF